MIPTPVDDIELMVNVGPRIFIGIINILKVNTAIKEISFLEYFTKFEVPKITKRFVINKNSPYIDIPKSKFEYKNPRNLLNGIDIYGTI